MSFLGNSLVVQWLGSTLLLLRAQVQSLVRERLRFCKPHSAAKKTGAIQCFLTVNNFEELLFRICLPLCATSVRPKWISDNLQVIVSHRPHEIAQKFYYTCCFRDSWGFEIYSAHWWVCVRVWFIPPVCVFASFPSQTPLVGMWVCVCLCLIHSLP